MSQAMVLQKPQGQALLDAYSTLLASNKILHLYKVDMTITDSMDLATVMGNEADFDGYAPFTLAAGFGVSSFYENLNAWALQVFNTWIATGGTTPNTIYGYFVTTDMDAALVGIQRFTTPIDVANTDDAVNCLARISYPPV